MAFKEGLVSSSRRRSCVFPQTIALIGAIMTSESNARPAIKGYMKKSVELAQLIGTYKQAYQQAGFMSKGQARRKQTIALKFKYAVMRCEAEKKGSGTFCSIPT